PCHRMYIVVVCFFRSLPRSRYIIPLSLHDALPIWVRVRVVAGVGADGGGEVGAVVEPAANECGEEAGAVERPVDVDATAALPPPDRKSTRLNSIHVKNSYAVFCLKKKSYKK